MATTSSMCSHISEQRITYASSILIPLSSLRCFPLLSSTWHQPTIVLRTSPEDERVRLGLFDSILTVYRCFPFSFFLVSFSAYMFLCLLQRLASVFGFLYGSWRVRYSPLLLLSSAFPSCVDICPSEGSDVYIYYGEDEERIIQLLMRSNNKLCKVKWSAASLSAVDDCGCSCVRS